MILAAPPARAQTPDEFPILTPTSNPFRIALGSDGNLWFTETYNGVPGAPLNIGRISPAITPGGHPDEFPLPPNQGGNYIATDPYGGTNAPLWFTCNGMCRLDPTAQTPGNPANVTVFPGVFGQGIAFTPDGGLWLNQGNGVARAVKSNPSPGTTVVYPTPGHVTTTYAATRGSDGNIWFIELDHYNSDPNSTGRIARIDLNHLTGCDTDPLHPCIKEYPVPGGEGAIGSSMTRGPDGALWTRGNGKVNRFDTALMDGGNGITQYDVPGPPGDITSGTDGQTLWFGGGNQVGRITTSGVLGPAIPVSPGPSGIAVGSDGNIWFCQESVANEIGRINLNGAPPPAPVRGGVVPLNGGGPQVVAQPRP